MSDTKKILKNTVKEGFFRCHQYTFVALPCLKLGKASSHTHYLSWSQSIWLIHQIRRMLSILMSRWTQLNSLAQWSPNCISSASSTSSGLLLRINLSLRLRKHFLSGNQRYRFNRSYQLDKCERLERQNLLCDCESTHWRQCCQSSENEPDFLQFFNL